MIIHSHWKGAAPAPQKKPAVQTNPVVRAEQPQPVEEEKVEIIEEVNKLPKKIRRVYFPEENRTIEM